MAKRRKIQVAVDVEAVEELDTVHCPLCRTADPFDVCDYGYQCQGCGAEFVVQTGQQLVAERPKGG